MEDRLEVRIRSCLMFVLGKVDEVFRGGGVLWWCRKFREAADDVGGG